LISLFLIQKGYSMASHQFLQKNRRQGGYTIVELAIAVSIVAVLIVAGLTGVQSILTGNKVSKQLQTTAKLSARISSAFGGNTATTGITLAQMANLNGWDPSQVVRNAAGAVTNVISAFGTQEFVATNTVLVGPAPVNSSIVYTITNVPRAGCADFASGLANIAYAIAVFDGAAAARVPAAADWTTAGTTVKRPENNIDLAAVAARCNTNNIASFDFAIALKP